MNKNIYLEVAFDKDEPGNIWEHVVTINKVRLYRRPVKQHSIIETGDFDSFYGIEDGHGEVVLSFCRNCRQGEGGLAPECPK